jgi:Coenzyme PQQ synthesis protein D (PqqD).
MRVRKNIATSEEGFLFNPTTGDSFSTNAIGTEIILLLKQGKSTKKIIEEMCNKYDVEQDLFERDLDEFTTVLKEFNILE